MALLAMAVAVPATMWLGLSDHGTYSPGAYIFAVVPFLALALLVPPSRWAAHALGILVTAIVMKGEVQGWQERDLLLGNLALLFYVGIVYVVAALVLLATIVFRSRSRTKNARHRSSHSRLGEGVLVTYDIVGPDIEAPILLGLGHFARCLDGRSR